MGNEEYIALTNEELYKLRHWFAGFIDMGRMGYRLDLTSDELAENVVNHWIKKKRKEEFKVFKNEVKYEKIHQETN
jgi:hypothetical protein